MCTVVHLLSRSGFSIEDVVSFFRFYPALSKLEDIGYFSNPISLEHARAIRKAEDTLLKDKKIRIQWRKARLNAFSKGSYGSTAGG
jgi:hypothetical protein